MTTNLKAGDEVVVATEGGKVGRVTEVAGDGMVGVNLAGEGRRVDFWSPSQVERHVPCED